MTKVVINTCFGGFSLSHEAELRYCEIAGLEIDRIEESKFFGVENIYLKDSEYDDDLFCGRFLERDDLILVKVVEELGERANGEFADLKVVRVPSTVEWYISEYDGVEEVHEEHRRWY